MASPGPPPSKPMLSARTTRPAQGRGISGGHRRPELRATDRMGHRAMKTVVRARKIPMPAATLHKVEVRLGVALGRFGERIARVVLRVSNTNPGEGPLQKCCEIVVFLESRRILVEGRSVDLLEAVDRAARRAARSVTLTLDRQPSWPVDGLGRRPVAGHRG